MHADPTRPDEYVPPGAAYKFCLFLALAAGGALIVPVHYLTPRKVAATEKEDLSDVVDFVPLKSNQLKRPIQLASAAQPLEPMPIPAVVPADLMPLEPMPLEPMPLIPMPLEATPGPTSSQALVSVEESPWYLEQPPAIEAAPTPIEQVPTADETYVFQDPPAAAIEAVEAADSVPPPPAPEATQPVAPLPEVAVQPTESPSDATAPPMPAVAIDAMPMPAPEVTAMQEPAPVVDAMPIEVAPIQAGRPITCTSPVPEPVAFSPLKPTMQQPPYAQQPVQPYAQQTRPAAQPTRPAGQSARPAAPQPQPVRQSYNHPGYGSIYSR